MKFLPMRVYHSDSLVAWSELHAAYNQHMEDLKRLLPQEINELADVALLDDGLVLKVDHDRGKKILKLTLRCGNLQIDYYDIVITYNGAKITPKHDRMLAEIAKSTKGFSGYGHDIHFHEFSVAKSGRITHRFLFNPGVQFAISCKSLTWKKVPRKNRKYPKVANRYISGPSTG